MEGLFWICDRIDGNDTYSNFNVTEENECLIASVNVRNDEDVGAEEIVQLYMQDVSASIVRPVKELKGFKKVFIKPQETVSVQIKLLKKDMGFFNNSMEYRLEDGISVSFEDWRKPAIGRAQVQSLFDDFGKTFKYNGRIERIDMPSSMKINMHEGGLSADAQWITMSAVSKDVDNSREKIEYMIGTYDNTYVKEEQLWKIKDIRWKY